MRGAGAGLVVGIDLATAGVRVTVADGGGRVAARGRAPLPEPQRPRPGWSEQDPGAWWPAVRSAVAEAMSGLERRAAAVVAVAVAATSGTVVVVDGDGRALGPALMYDDRRAAAEGDVAARAGAERWAALGFRPGPTSGLAKWAWLLGRPGVAGAARHGWHASDLVVSRLVGATPPTDWSHALKSGYDPGRREWATEAMDALGIPPALLPEALPPGSAVAAVSPEAAVATGLPASCHVRLGMTDACAAQLAAGADRPGRFATVLGTTMVVKGAADGVVHDPSGAVYSHRHPGGWWLPGGASNTGAAGRGDGDQATHAGLASLDGAARRRGPAGCVTYPLPTTGERFPFSVPDAEGFWLGEPADDAERHRAVLEGVAFLERLAYAHLADLGAVAAGPVRSAGGGGRSRVWAAIRATVLGRPVVVADGADTAFGACLLAAAGTLHPDLVTAVAAMVGEGEEVDPVEPEREPLDDSYRHFVAALAERGWVDDRLRRAALRGLR